MAPENQIPETQPQPQPQPQYQPPVVPIPENNAVVPPQPVPTQPAPAPMQPVPMTAPSFGAPLSGQTRNNKKLITIGAIVAGVLLLAVVAIVVLFSLFSASKKDYQVASDKMVQLNSAYNKIGSSYLSRYSTATEINNAVDTMKTARQDFNTQFDQLGNLKAVRLNKDANKLYLSAKTEKVKFNQAYDVAIESYENIYPALSSIGSLSSSDPVPSYNTILQKLNSITGLQQDMNKTYLSDLKASITKLSGLAAKVVAGRNDYTKYDSSVVSSYYDEISKLSDISKNYSSNLDKLTTNGDMTSDLSSLDTLLFNKSVGK